MGDANTQVVKKEPNPLSLKYPQGITEETITEKSGYVIRRILVKGDDAWVYTKKRFSFGTVVYKKDDVQIAESVWEMETTP